MKEVGVRVIWGFCTKLAIRGDAPTRFLCLGFMGAAYAQPTGLLIENLGDCKWTGGDFFRDHRTYSGKKAECLQVAAPG